MELRKWASNEPRVFSDLNHSTSERMIQSDKDPRTLGLFWKPEADELQYLVKEQEKQQITKRSQITIRLLCGKSRVALLKKISVPRLELQAALLLSQLTETENPADVISRGTEAEKLRDHDLWWKGSEWLSQPTANWLSPQMSYHVDTEPVLEELKCEHVLIVTSMNDFNLLERYSSLNKLVRITAYYLRFIARLKRNVKRRFVITKKVERSMIVDCPSATERSRAMNCLLKFAQARDFKAELKDNAESKQVSSRGRLYALNPFIDTAGLLRVGGRLINAPIAFEQKHPIILAPGNPLTLLIIAYEYNKLLHAGCQAVMSSLRTRYWPLSCKTIVKKFIKKCVKCFRAQPVSPEYTMGNSPSDRASPNRPFLTCGVDHAGPFFVVEKS
ncbi:uncharacterized protein LOC117175571 [Belonocnema kinseyi]|uniref:uncharacterized protein LOC117175571 n=1 Tax=Belonocnema kinseyi TaxID=2817044 RepID=UPI00143DA55D|nr:uncharacterized protein LOC117175571 [Belonocnema kinseyi]